jgi:hypothetical protein
MRMKLNPKAAAAALLALAGTLALPFGAANAGWRDYAFKHGAGYYVEKYADKYVTEDNRYKGSKHDKWSGEYYDTKTGKWTGKKHDGEYSSKSSKSTKTNTASVKPHTTKKYAAKPGSTTVSTTTAASAPKVKSTTSAVKKPPVGEVSEAPALAQSDLQTSAGPETEMYGPPMPAELAGVQAIQ